MNDSESNREAWLICALADAAYECIGTIYDHKCSVCGRTVMTALSGQKYLRENPRAKILCWLCYEHREPEEPPAPCGPLDDIIREVMTAQPNMRRHRN